MKSEKAITLTSLIIYVIGMVITIGTISTITTFFYKNINVNSESTKTTTQYTKLSSIFVEEINRKENNVVESKTYSDNQKEISYIIFSSGNQYTFKEENNSIYKNNIKICENVDQCQFSHEYKDSQYIIKVNLKIGNLDKTGENAIIYNIKNK